MNRNGIYGLKFKDLLLSNLLSLERKGYVKFQGGTLAEHIRTGCLNTDGTLDFELTLDGEDYALEALDLIPSRKVCAILIYIAEHPEEYQLFPSPDTKNLNQPVKAV